MSLKHVVIVTPDYSEKVGGAIVLHKLCHVLRKSGYDASLYPYTTSVVAHAGNWLSSSIRLLKQWGRVNLALKWGRFACNSSFDTPLYDGTYALSGNDVLIIYPETVLGNPLNGVNVVRWLLHQPGFHTGQMSFNSGDLLVRFNGSIKDVKWEGVSQLASEMKVIHYPLEHYYPPKYQIERSGTAVCIRKGAGKKFVHEQSAIVIDRLSHAEVAEVFRRSKYFISYDTYTAYSLFAVLCGCISVVVPDEGQTETQWYPEVEDRWGIAYGFEKIPFAQSTAQLQVERVFQQVDIVDENVRRVFAEIVGHFFK